MEQKGSKLLKIVSIIMMIGGIVSAVFSVIAAALAGVGTAVMAQPEVSDAIDSALATTGSTGPVMAVIWIAVVISVAGAVVEIIAGAKGKKNWDNPAAAKTLMIFGIVCAVLSLVANILFATGGLGVQIVSILSGLILPVLYIVGAVQLKNQA